MKLWILLKAGYHRFRHSYHWQKQEYHYQRFLELDKELDNPGIKKE